MLYCNRKFNINGIEWTLRCEKRTTRMTKQSYLKIVFGCATTKYVYSVDSSLRNNQLYIHNQAYTWTTPCKSVREAKLLVLNQLLK